MMPQNSEYVGALVRSILDSGAIGREDWREFSLVCGFSADGINQYYGYYFAENGAWEAFSVKPRLIREEANSYRDWLRKDDDKAIIKMLLQFDRESGQFNVDFEYDDPTRWQITPSNVDHMIEALRPKLGG